MKSQRRCLFLFYFYRCIFNRDWNTIFEELSNFYREKSKVKSLSHLSFSSLQPWFEYGTRRNKKGYLRHRSMFAFRFLGFGETTVYRMPPSRFVCGEIIVYSHSPKSISNLCCASRYCANIDPTKYRYGTKWNENSEYRTYVRTYVKKKKKIRIFSFYRVTNFQSFSINSRIFRTLIFFYY